MPSRYYELQGRERNTSVPRGGAKGSIWVDVDNKELFMLNGETQLQLSGTRTLEDSEDVTIELEQNGNVLIFNSTNSMWENNFLSELKFQDNKVVVDSNSSSIIIDSNTIVNANQDGVSIGSVKTSEQSSIFEINSNTQGMMIPRMTEAERNAIVDPANSLLIFNTDKYEINQWLTDGTYGSWGNIEIRPYYIHVTLSDNTVQTLTPSNGDYVYFTNEPGARFEVTPAIAIREFTHDEITGDMTYNGPSLPNIPCEIIGRFVMFDASGSEQFKISIFRNGQPVGIPSIFESHGSRAQTEEVSFITTLNHGDIIGFRIANNENNNEDITLQYADITIR